MVQSTPNFSETKLTSTRDWSSQ